MCTTILIGKKASYDGSTLVARIEDSSAGMFKSKKFIVVEPKDQPIHYKSVRTDCEIELPKNPMRYTCLPNEKKCFNDCNRNYYYKRKSFGSGSFSGI